MTDQIQFQLLFYDNVLIKSFNSICCLGWFNNMIELITVEYGFQCKREIEIRMLFHITRKSSIYDRSFNSTSPIF